MQSIDNFEVKNEAQKEIPLSYSEAKKQAREAAYNMIAEITEEVKKNIKTFTKYLNVQSRFDRYSVSNALLILKQKPEATRLSDFDTFKDEGRPVKKGQTGILLLTPGDEYTREDGSIGVEYKTKKVFDISQTNDKTIKETEIKEDIYTLVSALIHNLPTPIQVTDDTLSTNLSEERFKKLSYKYEDIMLT